jgi:N-carbamoyl-L-amino-acid hydrolase
MRNLEVTGARLWRSLMELAEIGATPAGGVCRLALTDDDKAGRDLFVAWCERAGCEVRIDQVGNIFARRAGTDPARASVMTGSHLDSQPTGGKFDGAYGVLAGLELIRTLNDFGIETAAPIEVVAWTNEEGSRFAPAMMASGVYGGAFTTEEVLNKTDNDGLQFGDELERIGYAGEHPVGFNQPAAYFEAHIEQGPILEAEEKTIGVVTDAQGQRWYEIEVTGFEAHAGPTPMPRRRDALVGAARMVDLVNRIGFEFAPNACATVGWLDVRPNSRNTIPGKVRFSVDFRHPDEGTLHTMHERLIAQCQAIATASQVEVNVEQIWHFPATPFNADLVDAVRTAAANGGYPHRDIVSGAGHDACYVARVAPTAMVFVPCEDGISHNEIESATPEDLAAGAQVLLDSILATAGGSQ